MASSHLQAQVGRALLWIQADHGTQEGHLHPLALEYLSHLGKSRKRGEGSYLKGEVSRSAEELVGWLSLTLLSFLSKEPCWALGTRKALDPRKPDVSFDDGVGSRRTRGALIT